MTAPTSVADRDVYTRYLERTRWFGGKHMGGDLFRHVQEAVRIYLETVSDRA